MAHFSEYVQVLVPDVAEARFSEPAQVPDTDVVAVYFSESVQEQSEIDEVLVTLVPVWTVQEPAGAVPADDQLLADAVLPDYFGFP